jgi:hypothetical protein
MGAVAARRRLDETDEAPSARRALGASERETPGMRQLLALAGRRNGTAGEEHHELVAEVLLEEIKAIGTLGGTEVREAVHLARHGELGLAGLKLVDAGFAHEHALHLAHLAGQALGSTAHAAKAANPIGLALGASLVHTKIALALIARAHEAGRRDAACRSYAQTWARAITDALFAEGVSRPEHTGLDHLDEARGRAFHDAMVFLRAIDGGTAGEIAAQLKQELGTRSNAFRALTEAVLREAGMTGLALYDASPVR